MGVMRALTKLPKNRLYRGDCLEVMQKLHGEGIAPDLIYLDPPFNSNRVYNIIFRGGGKGAQQTAFSDMWEKHYREETERDISEIAADIGADGRLIKLLKSWGEILGGGNADEKALFNYLIYMAHRLMWCHKVLAPHGSIYLHCDPTAGHYLKMVMDIIFGKRYFRNEIIWKRYRGKRSGAKYKYSAVTDSILFYGMPKAGEINMPFLPLREEYVRKTYKYNDNDGLGFYRYGGRIRDRKYYLENSKGIPITSLWDDVPELNGTDAEAMGYNTQKPMALLERIVNASSNAGDLVFDPFCGCGTTINAAHNLKRKWIGTDISLDAVKQIKIRIHSRISLKEEKHYDLIECGAQTREEYERLTPYEKQEWLVRQVGGVCGPKGGDGGVDGVIRYHKGGDGWNFDEFIISVKTGNQANPNMLDSLKGVMEKRGATMGGLILDREPTGGMLEIARRSPKVKYKMKIMDEMQKISEHLSVQILTAAQILTGEKSNGY